MEPEVIILLATYQGALFLEDQLQSLLNQDYPHFRILIRDDLSQDATPSLISHYQNSFPDKITVLPSGKRLGVIGNFAALMQAAVDQAPYIMFCDQDDIWQPGKIKQALALMQLQEQSQPCLVHTDLKVVDQHCKLIHDSFWKYSHLKPEGRETMNRLLVQNVVTGCTVMFNQALLKKALPIPKEAIMHDWWLALVASAFGKVVHSKQALIAYRQHSHNQLGAQKFGSLKQLFAKWHNLHRSLHALFKQAEAFQIQYEQECSDELKKLLEAFLEIPKRPSFLSPLLLYRHYFFKHGFLRNLLFMFLASQKAPLASGYDSQSN